MFFIRIFSMFIMEIVNILNDKNLIPIILFQLFNNQ